VYKVWFIVKKTAIHYMGLF